MALPRMRSAGIDRHIQARSRPIGVTTPTLLAVMIGATSVFSIFIRITPHAENTETPHRSAPQIGMRQYVAVRRI